MAPTHWTYKGVGPEDDLAQGDFLAPTPELRSILSEVHRHFDNDKYAGFVVATQSCDLVRRSDGAAARYISIAAVRSLYSVLPKLLTSITEPVIDRVFLLSKKQKAVEFLERLVEQNEQSLGLFYLHGDDDLGIGDPCVAYLRVTVALKSEHYETLLAARRGRLTPEFQAKFGWLIGNMYARPATTEWAEQSDGPKRRRELIGDLVDKVRWIDDAKLRLLQAERDDYARLAPDELLREAQKRKPKRLIEEAVEAMSAVCNPRIKQVMDARLDTFKHHIEKLTRPPADCAEDQRQIVLDASSVEKIREIAETHLCRLLTDKEMTKLKLDLLSDTKLKQLIK